MRRCEETGVSNTRCEALWVMDERVWRASFLQISRADISLQMQQTNTLPNFMSPTWFDP